MVLNLHGPLLRVYGCLSIETRLSGVCVPPACVPRRGSGQVSFSLSYVYIFDSPFSCTPQRCKDNAGTTTVCGIHSVGFVSFNSNIPRNSSSGICPWRRNWNSSDKNFCLSVPRLYLKYVSLKEGKGGEEEGGRAIPTAKLPLATVWHVISFLAIWENLFSYFMAFFDPTTTFVRSGCVYVCGSLLPYFYQTYSALRMAVCIMSGESSRVVHLLFFFSYPCFLGWRWRFHVFFFIRSWTLRRDKISDRLDARIL